MHINSDKGLWSGSDVNWTILLFWLISAYVNIDWVSSIDLIFYMDKKITLTYAQHVQLQSECRSIELARSLEALVIFCKHCSVPRFPS